jgi:hypothetical protein
VSRKEEKERKAAEAQKEARKKGLPAYEGAVTPETAQGRFLLFFPDTVEEAEKIIGWAKKSGMQAYRDSCTAKDAVQTGIGMLDGFYVTCPNRQFGALLGHWLCRADQLAENYVPPERCFLLEQFAALSEQITALSAKVARQEQIIEEMRDEVMPRRLKKPSTPGQGGAQ